MTANDLPSERRGYRPDIDGLRAVAVLAVVGFHVFPRLDPGGFVGVDIFFVISGFLISSIILPRLADGRFSFLDFYTRRARRIFPALVTVLLAGLLAGWVLFLAGEYRAFGKHVASAAIFVSNLMLWRESGYFDVAAEEKPLLHLWSLGIEEQFYLLWPVLLMLVARHRRLTAIVTAGLAAGSFAYCVYATFHTPDAAFFSPAARWWELMTGGLLAQLVRYRGTLEGRAANAASLLGAALIAVTLVMLDGWQPFPGWWALAPALGSFLILFAGPAGWVNRVVLSNRLMVGCGLISYPLYLWHWPLLAFANIWQSGALGTGVRIAIVVASILLATATYIFIERPIRSGAAGPASAIRLSGLLGAVGALGMAVYLGNGFAFRPVLDQVRAPFVVEDQDAYHKPCADAGQLPAPLAERCLSHLNPGGAGKVVMWGDSQAGMWAAPLERLAVEQGFELFVFVARGCPPLAGVRMAAGQGGGIGCVRLDTASATLEAIERLHPDVVVLAARWPLYAHGWIRHGELYKETHFLTVDEQGAPTRASSRAALAKMLPVTVEALQRANAAVVILKNPPVLQWQATDLRKSLADLRVPIAAHLEHSRFTDELLARLQNVDVIDPARTLCRADCQAEIDGHVIYVDDNHLSAQGVLLFKQEIGDVLQRRLRKRPGP